MMDINNFDFYIGTCCAKNAANILDYPVRTIGNFLVRNSPSKPEEFLLSVTTNSKTICHFIIPQSEKSKIRRENPGLKSVGDIVNFLYQRSSSLVNPINPNLSKNEHLNIKESNQVKESTIEVKYEEDDVEYKVNDTKIYDEKKLMFLNCFACDKANMKILFEGDSHMSRHQLMLCPICSKIISRAKQEAHKNSCRVKEEKYDETFACYKCDYETRDRRVLKKHIINHIRNSIVCSICKKGISTEKKLMIHMSRKHGEKIHCDNCDKNFVRIAYLRHKKFPCGDQKAAQKASKRLDLTVCNICQFKADYPCRLKIHKEQAHREKVPKEIPTYMCNFCEYKSKSKSNYNRHTKVCKSKPRTIIETFIAI